ncbi:MAG: WD40 repeat domain-containing serine/threonine protein kinase [Verrucomicrobiota bacterium]
MSDENLCVECGAPLPAELPKGLCSRCALSGALELGNDQSSVAAPRESAAAFFAAPGSEKSTALSSDAATASLRQFGDYELLEEIARGGMGIVYKARQISLDRIVALKLLLLGKYASQEFIHRFRIEASAVASLQHPNIVAIHEVGVHQDQHYFAMDFVDGPNLAQFIGTQPLPAKRAASYVKTVAEAIQFAHTRRILHRDLKPSNVLIDSNDQPRVRDFGLAKRFGVPPSGGSGPGDTGTPSWNLTVTGQVLGSPNFMPPEQASGRRGQMGPPSDVYSLGAILYHALTGRPPFVGEALSDTLHQVLNTDPVAPRLLVPSLPADLETICLKCLQKEPAKRFQSAQELADELGRFVRDEPIQARPVSRPEKLWRWSRRKPAIASLGAATILLLLAIAIGSPIAAFRISHARHGAEQNLYAANMNLAFKALELNNRGRVLALLEKHAPQKAADAPWEWRYLWKQTRSDELFPLCQSKYEIHCLTFSPDGKYLAAGEGRGRISIWDVTTTQRVAQCESPLVPCLLKFSSDARHLISANYKNGLWLWDWNPPLLTNHSPSLIAKGRVNGIDPRDGIVTAVDQDRQFLH